MGVDGNESPSRFPSPGTDLFTVSDGPSLRVGLTGYVMCPYSLTWGVGGLGRGHSQSQGGLFV